MYKSLKNNQRGAIAIITVIFITILLTIMTTSFIRLAINEQREATDDDLTTRAFYAAESGVQDAVRAINDIENTPLTHANECLSEGGLGKLSDTNNLDTEYTCQIIETTPSEYEAYLRENESAFLKIESGGVDIVSLVISWHVYGDSDSADGTNVVARTNSDLPKKEAWENGGNQFPAMIRAQVLEVPDSGINRTTIDAGNRVGFFNPVNGAGTSSLSGIDVGTISADCDLTSIASGDYVCEMKVTDFTDGTNAYFLRIKPLYRDAHIKIVAYSSADVALPLLGAQAVIDVTGRAGDVYRRVETRVNLESDNLWPDFAILSAESICKDFVITDNPADFTIHNSFSSPLTAPQSCDTS